MMYASQLTLFMPPTLYALFYRQPLRFDSTLKVVVNLAFHTFPAAHAIHASPHLWVVVVVVMRPAGTPVGARPRVLGLFEQDPPKMVDRGPCLGLVVGGRRWFWSWAKAGQVLAAAVFGPQPRWRAFR